MRKTILLLSISMFLMGCAADLEADRAAILAADAAWSDSIGDEERFVSFFAEGARFLPPDSPQATGEAAIRETYSEMANLPGFAVSWQANFADVSSSGDLGYSVGTFEFTADGPNGRPMTRTGTYGTVWRKQTDGQWKVVLDVPNFDSPADGG